MEHFCDQVCEFVSPTHQTVLQQSPTGYPIIQFISFFFFFLLLIQFISDITWK